MKKRQYVLNDSGALKKKLKHEDRKFDVSISKEAKDLSNVTVEMKASFFEFAKTHFLQELSENPNIIEVINAEGVKVSTESHGDAFVEYSLEISFKFKDL